MKNMLVLATLAGLVIVGSESTPAQSGFLDEAIVRVAARGGSSVNTEQGTGFVISADGLVATAYHVIHDASRIDVYFRGGQPAFDVTVAAIRPQADLALLRIPVDRVSRFYPVQPVAPPGSAGETLFVHGHPLGFPRQTITGRRTQPGYLRSQLWTDDAQRSIFAVPDLNLLPLDVTSEPGLSGSPVVDATGRVLAVFSGSLRRGGGYAWAVPVDYLRTPEMQNLNLRASAVQWPRQVSFLNAGITLLRALSTSSGADQPGQKCREGADAFSNAWNRYYSAQVKLGVRLAGMESTIRSARQQLTPATATQVKNRLRVLFDFASPDLESVEAGFESSSASLGDVVADCFGQAMLRLLPEPTTPGTYENIVASMRFARQIEALSRSFKTSADQQQALEGKFAPFIDRLLDGGAVVKNPRADDYELAGALLDILDAVVQVQKMASEDAGHAANVISNSLVMAELQQRLSMHEWETAHRTHEFLTAGLRLNLADGWLPYDQRLRSATLRPGVTLPPHYQIVYFGTVKIDNRIDAFADAATETVGFATPPVEASDDRFVEHWRVVDRAFAAVTQREGVVVPTVDKSRTAVGGDPVLEATGIGRIDGRDIAVYVGVRFRGNRAARVHCFLQKQPWNEYRLCTALTDSMSF